MLTFALIADGFITNRAIASNPPEAEWLAAVQAEFDHVIDVTALDPQPQIGWSYDGSTFAPPPAPEEPLA